VLLDVDGFYAPLRQQIERAVADGFDDAEVRDYFVVAEDAAAAVSRIERAGRGARP
jgi:predicted Rossmann-fold nucleotide-binding protein